MANLYWLGTATAVAQVWTATIDSVDGTPANNTFTVTIGGVAIDAVGDTDVATTATNLRASLNASTHPYFAAITWSGSAGDIIGTADTAGMAFLAALTETGAGTGAVTDFVATTANASPYDWGTADNWSTGAVPVNSDVVYIDQIGAKILYTLDQSAVTLTELHVRQDAVVGLKSATFATDEAATTESASAPEYRDTYLKVQLDACRIGEQVGPGAPTGSARCKIWNTQTTANITEVFGTASTALETGAAAVRLLIDSANSDLSVRSARGGVGVAVDTPGETSTVGDVFVEDTSSVTKLYLSDGVTATSLTQFGGVNSIKLAATLATIEVNGGTLTVEGDQIVTALTVDAGTVYINNVPSGAVCVTTLHQNGGTVNFQGSSIPRTVTTYNFNFGTRAIDDHLTITADNRTGRITETVI